MTDDTCQMAEGEGHMVDGTCHVAEGLSERATEGQRAPQKAPNEANLQTTEVGNFYAVTPEKANMAGANEANFRGTGWLSRAPDSREQRRLPVKRRRQSGTVWNRGDAGMLARPCLPGGNGLGLD